MSIKCLLCGEEFGMVTHAHLKSAHDVTLDEYRAMFPGVEFWSTEDRKEISKSVLKAMTPKVGLRISDSLVAHHVAHGISEEVRRKMSERMKGNEYALGYVTSEETKRLLSKVFAGREFSDEWRQKISEAKIGHTTSEKTRQEISETLKERWKDPEFARRVVEAQSRKPNETELQLQSILYKHFPGEWKYTGDGAFWIEGRNPDFANINGKKQIIEVFGIYWHLYQPNRPSEEELIAHYRTFGFDCLIFWEYDVWNEDEVVKQVSKFMGCVRSA